MLRLIPVLFSVLSLGACAGPVSQIPPPGEPIAKIKEPAPAIASFADQQKSADRDAVEEARMKAEVEPKAVQVIRDILAPNPADPRYGIPSYARFQRTLSPTLGNPGVRLSWAACRRDSPAG
jgi:hypothetical protein